MKTFEDKAIDTSSEYHRGLRDGFASGLKNSSEAFLRYIQNGTSVSLTLNKPPLEIIICAAVQRDGKVFMGHRHNDAIFTAINNKCQAPIQTHEQGFVTSTNRYVDRKEAMLIARKAGQTDSKGEELFSEDLY